MEFSFNSVIKWIFPLFLLFCTFSLEECKGENILFYFPLGHSHRQSVEPLAHSLSEKGHDVTIFSVEKPIKYSPKIKDFVDPPLKRFIDVEIKEWGHLLFQFRWFSKHLHILPSALLTASFDAKWCSAVFNSSGPDSGFQRWVNSAHFDLMIIDSSVQKCAFGLAHKFGAKIISFSPTGISHHENEVWGWHSDSSWAPTFALSNVFSRERTFYDRIFLTVYPIFTKFVMEYFSLPAQEKIVRESLNMPDMPPLRELEEKVSLLLLNQHPSSDYARSYPPFVVPVGGMHCDVWQNSAGNETRPRKLPQKMAEFIDGAGEDGFIFVSFGTIFSQMSGMPEELLNTFFEAMRGRKTRFLWKWDADPPKNTPENLFTAEWFPQQDLLAHPKIRGFITHGGIMSYQQSVANGVPVIVIPFSFDQPFFAAHAQHHLESGIHLEFSELTVEKMSGAIDSILNDKIYKENAQKAQGQFLDRPESPIDLALFWTEYVLRHGDISHLKPTQAMAQFWWQRHLLDVWLFLLILTILSSWAALKILTCIFKRLTNTKQGSKPKTQ